MIETFYNGDMSVPHDARSARTKAVAWPTPTRTP